PTGQLFTNLPQQPTQPYFQGWSFTILPFMEQGPFYNAPDRSLGIKTYQCPSRGRNPSNGTTAPAGPVTDYALNGVSFNPLNVRVSMSAITNLNGTSNTIYAGEKAMDPNNYNGSAGWDECILEGNGGCNRQGNLLMRDAVGNNFGNNWGS